MSPYKFIHDGKGKNCDILYVLKNLVVLCVYISNSVLSLHIHSNSNNNNIISIIIIIIIKKYDVGKLRVPPVSNKNG